MILCIIHNTELPEFLRIDAMNVVEEHLELFADNSDSIIELFNADLDEDMTYAILKIIDAYGKAEEQLDIILESYNMHDKINDSLISLDMLYFKILQGIKTIESATKVFCFIASQPEKIEEDEWKKVFEHCCNIGIHCFSGENDCFLQLIKAVFQDKIFCYFNRCCEIITKYIVETHTESAVLASILAENETIDITYKLYFVLCESMVECIISEYKQDRIKNEIIIGLSYRAMGNDEINKKLQIAFFTKTHESIPRIRTYEESREAETLGHQLYFNALFEKESYANLVNRLGEIFGVCKLISDSHLYEFHQRLKEEPELRDAINGLHYLIIHEDKETTFANVMSRIKDWNVFFVLAAENVLRNHLHNIKITNDQRDQIERAVFGILSPEILNVTFINAHQYNYSPLLPPCLQIIRILNIKCPERIIDSMLIIPFHLLDRDEHRTIPKYITEHLAHEKLVGNVIQNIKENKWNSFVAPNYINYCIDNRIAEVKQEIIEYLFDDKLNYFGIYEGLEYLVKLFGYKEIEKSVLPRCTTEELLRSIAHHIPLDVDCKLLESKMIEMYRISRNEKWLPLLIRRSNIEAMEEYYQIASTLNRIPDLTEGSEVPFIADAFRQVRRKEALPILLRLFQLTFSPGFMDKEYFGLYSGCWEAIVNIAKNYYDETFTCLEYARTHDLSPFDIAISDLLNTIKAGRIITIDTPMSFETALSFI